MKRLFWITTFFVLIFIALQLLGFSVLEIVLCLLVLDLIILNSKERKSNSSDINKIKTMIESIEKTQRDISSYESDQIREEFNKKLDRMAEKIIEIENKLNELRKTKL